MAEREEHNVPLQQKRQEWYHMQKKIEIWEGFLLCSDRKNILEISSAKSKGEKNASVYAGWWASKILVGAFELKKQDLWNREAAAEEME